MFVISISKEGTRMRNRAGTIGAIWLALSLMTTVASAGNEKLSPDLQSGFQSKHAAGSVDVIVQYKVPPTEAHHQRVVALGGKLRSELHSIKGAHYSIPASQLETLANDPDVAYISPTGRSTAC